MQFGCPDIERVHGYLRKAIETGAYPPGRESSFKTTIGVCYCRSNPGSARCDFCPWFRCTALPSTRP